MQLILLLHSIKVVFTDYQPRAWKVQCKLLTVPLSLMEEYKSFSSNQICYQLIYTDLNKQTSVYIYYCRWFFFGQVMKIFTFWPADALDEKESPSALQLSWGHERVNQISWKASWWFYRWGQGITNIFLMLRYFSDRLGIGSPAAKIA